MDRIKNDSRFSHITKDARFRNISRRDKKVKIDKRFQSMFTDDRFQIKTVVDKRGRPHISRGSEHLERFYDLSGSEEDSDSGDESKSENEERQEKEATKYKVTEKDDAKNKQEDVVKTTRLTRKDLPGDIKAKLKDLSVDYARGEGIILSDSSSDEESSSEEEVEEVDHEWGERDKEASVTNESTARLALCNMDWDRITAQDIMVLINSFVPSSGVLKSVTIYPSEFGLQRMKEEEEKGPTELAAMPAAEEQDDESLSVEQREKLRDYQLKRLRYYYAVLVFDSVSTADRVYKECDGLEYESSMNRLDLRFVPDDTEFDQTPREECTSMPEMGSYKPRLYRTSALTQVKVDLTWDETDPSRQEMIRAAHQGKLSDDKLNNFLASSSGEESEEEEEVKTGEGETNSEPISEKKAIEKYKALLAGLSSKGEENTKEEEGGMEVTWDTKVQKDTEDKEKELAKASNANTPFEKYLEKRKDKKKQKKELRKDDRVDESEDGASISDDDVPSDIDMDDPYFKEELTSAAGKGKGKKRKGARHLDEEEDEMEQQKKAELELLMLDDKDDGNTRHFSLKKIEEQEKKSKKKRKFKKKTEVVEKTDDDFKMDVKDERFSAIFSSHLYNVDPAAANFKATEGMKAIIAEKVKRLNDEPIRSEPSQPFCVSEKRQKDAELNLLVKSVQRKTQQAISAKKRKKEKV